MDLNRFGTRRGVLGVLCMLAAGAGAAALASERPDRPQGPPSATATAATAEAPDGRALYLEHCAACHGERGFGDGEAAYLLFPSARDFSAYHFRLVSTENGVPTDEDLFEVVTRGMLGSAMPPHAHLPEADRRAIVKEVRRLMTEETAKRMLEQAAGAGEELDPEVARDAAFREPGRVLVPPPAPPPTPEMLAQGRMLYVRICAGCHDLDGTGRSRQDLLDSLDRPIFARDFTAGILKGGTGLADIFRRVRCGMGGTPMPSNDLTDADTWALVHYTKSMIRPGAQERLSQRRTDLAARRIPGPIGTDPADAVWKDVPPVWVPLTPLWWREPRVEGVLVQAAHDGSRLALRLTWEDATEDASQTDQRAFSDACAVQWSAEETPPFFAMGRQGAPPVDIWYWRAAFQADGAGARDVEPLTEAVINDVDLSRQDPSFGAHASRGDCPLEAHQKLFITGWGAGNLVSAPDRAGPVDSLMAAGFGTLGPRGAGAVPVEGRGRFERGFWEVVMVRPMAGCCETGLEAGAQVSVAFAVWNGAAADRNGEKNVTIWHRMKVED